MLQKWSVGMDDLVYLGFASDASPQEGLVAIAVQLIGALFFGVFRGLDIGTTVLNSLIMRPCSSA